MLKDLSVKMLWDVLADEGYFTNDELQLLTNINGYSVETLNSAIFARYGYRNLDQLLEYY